MAALDLIPILRKVNIKHSKFLNSLKMGAPEKSKEFPELHREVFDLNHEDEDDEEKGGMKEKKNNEASAVGAGTSGFRSAAMTGQ